AAEHRRVLVCSEGLLAYLETEKVEALARDLCAQPTFAWWLLDFLSPAIVHLMSQKWGLAEVKFAPPGGMAFFARLGWRALELRWALDDAAQLGRQTPMGRFVRAAMWLMGPTRRDQLRREKLPGSVLLARSLLPS